MLTVLPKVLSPPVQMNLVMVLLKVFNESIFSPAIPVLNIIPNSLSPLLSVGPLGLLHAINQTNTKRMPALIFTIFIAFTKYYCLM